MGALSYRAVNAEVWGVSHTARSGLSTQHDTTEKQPTNFDM